MADQLLITRRSNHNIIYGLKHDGADKTVIAMMQPRYWTTYKLAWATGRHCVFASLNGAHTHPYMHGLANVLPIVANFIHISRHLKSHRLAIQHCMIWLATAHATQNNTTHHTIYATVGSHAPTIYSLCFILIHRSVGPQCGTQARQDEQNTRKKRTHKEEKCTFSDGGGGCYTTQHQWPYAALKRMYEWFSNRSEHRLLPATTNSDWFDQMHDSGGGHNAFCRVHYGNIIYIEIRHHQWMRVYLPT